MLKWITILLAVLGVALAAYAALTEGKGRPPAQPPAAPPSVNPFASGIAATGVIEPISRSIPIGTPEPGLVTQVFVEVGQAVKPGDPLLMLDDRSLKTDLVRLEAQRAVVAARIDRWKAFPRAETLPPLEALVAAAQVQLADAQDRLGELTSAQSAVPQSDISRARAAVELAKAQLARAKADLDLTKSGTWIQEIAVEQAELARAQAEIQSVKLRIERLTVRAPIAGTILKRNVEPGQYAGLNPTGPANLASTALLVLADISTLRVRARVDEEDAPQLRDNARAAARVRGVVAETIPLTWKWIEPLAEAKNVLTGTTTERVDTRVVEVMFDLASKPIARLIPGQVVDVFIEVQPRATPSPAPSPIP
jgi:multidrug efflux pump subunit AcrA (membrane-fusion protein)